MAESYHFRTALNGFHREDVVHYLEYINTRHQNQLNQLRDELAAAQQEAQSRAVLAGRVLQLEAQCQELQQQLAAAQQPSAPLPQAPVADPGNRELEAYRRAERTERQARQRASQLYTQANGVLADTAAQVDDAAKQLEAAAGQTAGQLEALLEMLNQSKQILRQATQGLQAIRPEE